MSSGYFPLEYENAKTLKECIEKIDAVYTEQCRLACEDLNGEDGAADGVYLGYLDIASELLSRCIKKTTQPPTKGA